MNIYLIVGIFAAAFGIIFFVATHSVKKTACEPAYAPVDVRTALAELLDHGKSGGFVVFEGNSGSAIVQYSLEANGLQLCSIVSDDKRTLLLGCLKSKGYSEVTLTDKKSKFPELKKGQFIILNDELYCQVGRDVEEIRVMTIELMSRVFNCSDESSFNITLEPNG